MCLFFWARSFSYFFPFFLERVIFETGFFWSWHISLYRFLFSALPLITDFSCVRCPWYIRFSLERVRYRRCFFSPFSFERILRDTFQFWAWYFSYRFILKHPCMVETMWRPNFWLFWALYFWSVCPLRTLSFIRVSFAHVIFHTGTFWARYLCCRFLFSVCCRTFFRLLYDVFFLLCAVWRCMNQPVTGFFLCLYLKSS